MISMKLDKKDEKIIEILRENGRTSYSQLAKAIGLSDVAVKKRLDNLTAEWCEALSIPSNREFEEVAKAIHDLRRKVRVQEKTIEALKQKLEKMG